MISLADEERMVAQAKGLDRKQWIAAAIFAVIALYMAKVVPSIEIAWVSGLLLFTIYLFAFEVVGVDVAATTVMVLLGLTSLLAPVMGLAQGLVDTQHLFDRLLLQCGDFDHRGYDHRRRSRQDRYHEPGGQLHPEGRWQR